VTRRLLLACTLAFPALPLAGQIGYDPARSPFGDIRTSSALEFYAGQAFGSGGPIPVAPRDGQVAGARVMLRARNTLSIGLGAWFATTQRSIVDANAPVASRISGPIDHRLLAGEVTVQFNLTGGKHWKGLAPFTGINVGMANGQATPPVDTSGYSFGTKFYFAPMVGTRVILGARTYLKAEGRLAFWNIKYPVSYSQEPSLDPGTEENPNAVNPTGRRGQYVTMPQLTLGLGWGF
jgi:hypothetical protein